jgi:hypothetical protein
MATDLSSIKQAQFIFGGRNCCFYLDGWHGPGFYWCGYAYRRGLGWGGPEGWRGWHHSGGGGHSGGTEAVATQPVATEADTVAAVTGAGTDIADVQDCTSRIFVTEVAARPGPIFRW